MLGMSEAKHTPGPWSFKVAPNGDCGIMANGTGIFAEAFADIRHAHECNLDEALANARLIAAAPDMLDALKAMRDDATIKAVCASPLWAQMVNAIEKAEGRG